jgi:hypothetical protein
MIKRGLRSRALALCAATATVGLTSLAVPSAASADTMRTLNLAFSCSTGLPYGLEVSTGSGWYFPNGSSYAVGTTKYFTVYIPASATSLAFMPTYCDNEPSGAGYNPTYAGYAAVLSPGTSTINATGSCYDYDYSYGQYANYLIYDCTISSLSYS